MFGRLRGHIRVKTFEFSTLEDVHWHAYRHRQKSDMPTQILTSTCMLVHTHTHTHTHACTHARTHAHTHTHMYLSKQAWHT